METPESKRTNDEGENIDYTHLGNLYHRMDETQKKDYIDNIIHSMKAIDGPDKENAINLQLCHWFRTDIGLGIAVAKGLELDLDKAMAQMR